MRTYILCFMTLFFIPVSNGEDIKQGHIEPSLTLFFVLSEDYELRDGSENDNSSMKNGLGVDMGYQFTVFDHFRINPYVYYRSVEFTNMTNHLYGNRAQVIGVASTLELDWNPENFENLMNISKLFIPLYLMKIGVGVNVISFHNSNEAPVPALSYTLGFGFPYKRVSIHLGGEGNIFTYSSKITQLDAYKVRIGYWF